MQVDEKARPPRELVWNEYHDEQGNPDRWDAETPFNTYYGIALLLDGYSVQHDYTDVAKQLESLDEAKEAAAADCAKRCTAYLASLGEREPVAEVAAMEEILRKQGERDIPFAPTDEDVGRAAKAVSDEWGKMVAEMSQHMSPGDIARSFVSPGNHRLIRAALEAAGGSG